MRLVFATHNNSRMRGSSRPVTLLNAVANIVGFSIWSCGTTFGRSASLKVARATESHFLRTAWPTVHSVLLRSDSMARSDGSRSPSPEPRVTSPCSGTAANRASSACAPSSRPQEALRVSPRLAEVPDERRRAAGVLRGLAHETGRGDICGGVRTGWPAEYRCAFAPLLLAVDISMFSTTGLRASQSQSRLCHSRTE